MSRLDKINQKYGRQLFLATFNGFFIDSGLLPDFPTGMRIGQFKNRAGIWIPGVLYTQYQQWEPEVENIFDIQRFDN